jgi:dTDP-4-amino-4,6-dideoxygalactose transaminase
MYRDLPSAAPGGLPVACDAAARILCLPIYPDLKESDQMRIIEIVRGS